MLGSSEALQYVRGRHRHWSDQGRDRASRILSTCRGRDLGTTGRVRPPGMRVLLSLGDYSAGLYTSADSTCWYRLPFAMVDHQRFDVTVAHEVAHHYTRILWPGSVEHGDLFEWFLVAVLGVNAYLKPTHRYDQGLAAVAARRTRSELPDENRTETKFGTALDS